MVDKDEVDKLCMYSLHFSTLKLWGNNNYIDNQPNLSFPSISCHVGQFTQDHKITL